MRNEDFNEKQLQELENELRGLGTPYSAEPDSRYLANFRVRVMERIREEEAAKAAPWYEQAIGWIEDHLLISSLSTAAVLVGIWGALMMQPLEPARHQMAVVPKPVAPQVQQAPVQSVQVAPQNLASAESPKFVAKAEVKKVATHSEQSQDLAMLDVPVASAVDVGPVSLDELSAPELQTVLKTLETE